ncbi:hypothetical protein TWF696_001561 [Orbilia brochopaga]|uniref:Uncharacterized protein n=1 Tax=Orbilia brochopaga TaxID=3140254 RepID=A0AAV9UD02_9PEZI
MGLAISRYIIAMEAQSSNHVQPCPTCGVPHTVPVISLPDNAGDPADEFHPRRRLRIFLGLGIIFQAGLVCFFGLVYSLSQYYSSNFILELSRFVTILYLVLFLYPAVTWYLSIYYNKPIPRTKAFLICELLRVIPALLLAGLFVYALLIAFITMVHNTIMYWPGIGVFIMWIVTMIPGVFVIFVSLWSLIWLWLYFIKSRQEELQKLLGIGRKREDEDPKGKAPEREREPNLLGRDDAESGEETPLLVDRAQMV